MSDIARDARLAWCKRRALEYVDRGDLDQAVASMASDLTKHPETNRPANSVLHQLGLMCAINGDAGGVRRWIEGFR